ncbi:hypothetical protein C479_09198 [Halovivax asiaticus JCM 14624]|uniref:Asparagine synthetase domain-containing protein n=1 Tax=Halovivax asiaticus JCM 14624 TaxID=1227490 RepID=M0BJE6_9EURY|nr:hypothetical protein C479_09198 [Halovivax asiaticus JCM 14624]
MFGDSETFSRFRSPSSFDRVVEGRSITVGVRDVGIGMPGRTAVHADGDRVCTLVGEAYAPGSATSPAALALERRDASGFDAMADVSGSYLAAVDTGETAYVATDPARTVECFYADASGVRVFGTDAFEVARTIPDSTVRRDSLLEFLHLGVVLGDKTLVSELHRAPFDGRLHADGTGTFDRFVYRPTEFDYVEALAGRLERALERRRHLPGRKGLLLSAGYDSRAFLAGPTDVDACYTVTRQNGREAAVAARIADQYGSDHTAFEADGDYLTTGFSTVRYGNGIRESIHAHHAAFADRMDVETMYHGLLFDTFLRGHYLPRDEFSALGHALPRSRLATDFDPATSLVTDSFGFVPISECDGLDGELPAESLAFARDAVGREFSRLAGRYDSTYDGCAVVGIANQPTAPFRTHLADHFLESFPAADGELVDWHLRTPPEYRNTRTFRRALERIDGDVLRHRPPDRPHDSVTLNEVEQFVRERAPFLDAFENAWPDRREEYERANLDDELFPDQPSLHGLPVLLKLRINDATTWLGRLECDTEPEPARLLSPPAEQFRLRSE